MPTPRELVKAKIKETIFIEENRGRFLITFDQLVDLSGRESRMLYEIIYEVATAQRLDVWIEDDLETRGVWVYWEPTRSGTEISNV
jgi:hypothetical protein